MVPPGMNCVVLKTYPPRLTIENPPLTIDSGAQEKTRTSTTLRPQVPETCASTNSATWATVAHTGGPSGGRAV
jgi:hypothetical protein